jgi:UDP-glucose 4-epimerase
MRIVVSGGSGYLGTHLIHELQSRTCSVVNIDLNPSSLPKSIGLMDVQMDIRRTDLLKGLLLTFKPDVVIHLAALKSVPESISKPNEYFSVNAHATGVIAKLAAQIGVKKFLFASSAAVYGKTANVNTSEDFLTLPLSPYGESKLLAEKLLAGVLNSSKMDVQILRIFNLMGFSEQIAPSFSESSKGSLQFEIWESLAKKTPFSIFGSEFETSDGTALRDYIHPKDVVANILQILDERKTLPNVMNVGSGEGKTVLEILKKAEEIAQRKITSVGKEMRSGDIPAITANISLISKSLNFNLENSSTSSLLNFLRYPL